MRLIILMIASAWSSVALAEAPPTASSSQLPAFTTIVGCQAKADLSVAAAKTRPPLLPGTVALWVKKGHGRYCTGFGLCFISGSPPDTGPHCRGCIEATIVRGDTGTVVIDMAKPEGFTKDEPFFVDTDLALPAYAVRALGGRGTMSIVKGRYSASESGGNRVRVVLKVS